MNKVLYILNSSRYSGAEIVLTRLILNNKKNVNPIVICPEGELSNMLKSNDVKTIICNALAGLQRDNNNYSLFKIIQKIASNIFSINSLILSNVYSNNIKTIHANTLTSAIYTLPSLFISKILFAKKKWIWSNHDINYLVDGKRGKHLAKALTYFYDKTIAVSNAVKDSIVSSFNSKRIIVLYNGIDLKKFKSDETLRYNFRQNLNIPDNTIVMSMFGSIADYKGQDIVINSFSNVLKNTQIDLRLLIIGRKVDSNFWEIITKLDSYLFNKDKIFFYDHTENVIEFYNGIDILINATKAYRSEPLGTSLIEAMALKKIVMASNTGGSMEIIDDKKNGFIFESDNEDDLTDKLQFVISDFDNQDHLRNSAYNKVFIRFNIETMIEKYNQILNLENKI